jgi:hypothetical protein
MSDKKKGPCPPVQVNWNGSHSTTLDLCCYEQSASNTELMLHLRAVDGELLSHNGNKSSKCGGNGEGFHCSRKSGTVYVEEETEEEEKTSESDTSKNRAGLYVDHFKLRSTP